MLNVIKFKKILLLIVLTSCCISNANAGWLDKNLDKLNKAKELLKSSNKDKAKKTQAKPLPETSKPSQAASNESKQQIKSQTNKKSNSASLHPGEIISIKLSNNGNLKTLELNAFKGLRVYAGGSVPISFPDLQKKTGIMLGRLKIKISEINRQRFNDYQLYHKLYAIQNSYQSLNKETLKKAFYNKLEFKNQQQHAVALSWKKMAGYLAVRALSDESYKKYFCPSGKCNLRNDRNDQEKRIGLNMKLFWGGRMNTNEFKSRRLINQFVDNEFSDLVNWSKKYKFSLDEIVIKNFNLPAYNFKKSYFDLGRIKVEKDELGPKRTIDSIVKIPADEAEVVLSEHKNKKLYYYYKLKISISNQSYIYQSKIYDPYNISFDYSVTSKVIPLYWGAELKTKWVELPVRLKKVIRGGNTQSIFKGTGGLSKSKECSNYKREHPGFGTITAKAKLCQKSCLNLEAKIKRSREITQDEIDQCNSDYAEFKYLLSFE